MSSYVLCLPHCLCRIVKVIKLSRLFRTSHCIRNEPTPTPTPPIVVPTTLIPSALPKLKEIKREVRDVEIPVPWGQISGKWWGNPNIQPVLLLHGWQDNAGSFDRLVPLLTNESLFALDMVGHGKSSHYQIGQCCHYVDALVNLRRVIQHFKWEKVKIIGHSIGSSLGFAYAAIYPDAVDKLVSVEGARAVVAVSTGQLAKDVRDVIDANLSFEKKIGKPPPKYSYEDVTDLYLKGIQYSTDKEMCKPILDRGLQKRDGDDLFCFSRDPRVKFVSWGSFSVDLVMATATQITCEILNIRALKGYTVGEKKIRVYQQTLEILQRTASRFSYHEVEGTHYVHLNNPNVIAPLINEFLEKTPPEVIIY